MDELLVDQLPRVARGSVAPWISCSVDALLVDHVLVDQLLVDELPRG